MHELRSDLSNVALIWLSTLRRKRWSLLWFALAVAAFHWLVAVSFPAIGGMEAVTSVVRTFPDGLRTLLKLAPNLQAGFGVQDYLAFTWIHPLFIGLGAAFVVARATDALTGEIERGAIYLVLSRPLRRWSFVLGKALEMTAGAGVIALAGWIGLAVGVQALPYALPLGNYLRVALMAWLLFGALGGGALLIASGFSRTSPAGGLAIAWTLISFVLDVIPAIANSPVGWLNPWHYYFPQEIVASGRLDPVGVGVMLGWLVGGVAGAIWVFGRRDLA
ncbi:MAG TPA: ABC transporter permease subunit [Chloroflexi bacterium]|nr:ABC transporter permease subunit [Chloroflexota bacterium]